MHMQYRGRLHNDLPRSISGKETLRQRDLIGLIFRKERGLKANNADSWLLHLHKWLLSGRLLLEAEPAKSTQCNRTDSSDDNCNNDSSLFSGRQRRKAVVLTVATGGRGNGRRCLRETRANRRGEGWRCDLQRRRQYNDLAGSRYLCVANVQVQRQLSTHSIDGDILVVTDERPRRGAPQSGKLWRVQIGAL